MIQKKPRKPKKCKACGILFTPERSFQVVCDYRCGLAYNKAKAIESAKKIKNKKDREAKERIKTRSDWMGEAQASFNAYIRERDRDKPCISCGTTGNVQYAAGHYRSIGSCPELRFNEFNVHKQCNMNCNKALSGNSIKYRIHLIEKIGVEMVDWIEGPHESRHYTIDDLKRIKAEYKEKLKELKASEKG